MKHVTCARIDLGAVRHNLAVMRRHAQGRAILVPLKANGYGHGAVPIAQDIQDSGLAEWLGVATVPEGIELREAGITLPILKLSQAYDDEIASLIEYDMVATVIDHDTIQAIADGAQAADKPFYPVHLAVDTGMRRIGCEPEDARELAKAAADLGLDVQGVFTHFPAADSAAQREFTHSQMVRFTEVVYQINDDRRAAGMSPLPWVHAANSAGLLGCELGCATMVRPGIVVFGYSPNPRMFLVNGYGTQPVAARGDADDAATSNDATAADATESPCQTATDAGATAPTDATADSATRPDAACTCAQAAPKGNDEGAFFIDVHPALTWVARVSMIKPVGAGETVGYGRSWTAEEDCWIATVSVGYADGLSRDHSNRGRVLIGGRSFPIVGRLCMDQLMVNLGPIATTPHVHVGDEVVLCGRQGDLEITVDELAERQGTINYEVTCALSPRVKRVYISAEHD